jgi:hypothetical protein
MKLVGVAIVRNEADIIETFVRHNLTVVDALAVVDHGSFDGTSEILAALAAEGLPLAVGRDDSTGFRQAAIATRAVREILGQSGADYVFMLDADEFLKARSRESMEHALAAVPVGMHAVVEWQTYVPDFVEAQIADVRACITGSRRLARERHGKHKVVVARHFRETPHAMVAMGNHLVVPSAEGIVPGRSLPHAKLGGGAVALAHFPVRGREQLTAKIAIGWLANLAAGDSHPDTAYHWRELYAELAAGSTLTPERLRAIAANYGLRQREWRAPDAIEFVDDPFLAPTELRYAHLARRDALALVLRFAEKLAAGSGSPKGSE